MSAQPNLDPGSLGQLAGLAGLQVIIEAPHPFLTPYPVPTPGLTHLPFQVQECPAPPILLVAQWSAARVPVPQNPLSPPPKRSGF